MKKKKQIAMLREWLGEVLNNADSVTVKMPRVPTWDKDYQDWPGISEFAAMHAGAMR